MQRLPTATAAGAGMTSLLVVLLLVSVLPGASGADSGPLDGRKMVFAGETAGVLARYSFNKVTLDRHIYSLLVLLLR